MKAVIFGRYGGPEVLRIEDMPMPLPAAGQILVKVAATSVNLSDWECLLGSPAYARVGAMHFRRARRSGPGAHRRLGGRAAQRPLHHGARRQEGQAHFQPLADVCANGEVAIPIARTFSLEEVPAALVYVGDGQALGKVVIVPC